MAKLTFDDVMERLGDERAIDRNEVLASALKRSVWVAEWHIPGCLSESCSVCASKRDAIECALSMAESDNGAPRGMKTALQRYGRFDCRTSMYGDVINTVSRRLLSELL